MSESTQEYYVSNSSLIVYEQEYSRVLCKKLFSNCLWARILKSILVLKPSYIVVLYMCRFMCSYTTEIMSLMRQSEYDTYILTR